MDINLLTIEPEPITEAASNEDLARALTAARQRPGWSRAGVSRFGIMEEIDPTFVNHAEHYERMMHGGTTPEGRVFPSAKGIERVTFSVTEASASIRIDGSREWKARKHSYATTIRFENYAVLRRAPQLNWTERARLLLRDNLKVNCTCEAFRFFHANAATVKGFALIPETRPAPKNNPSERGGVCKHLQHALHYLGPQYPKIASAMKQAHGLREAAQESRMTQVHVRVTHYNPAKPKSEAGQWEGHDAIADAHGVTRRASVAKGVSRYTFPDAKVAHAFKSALTGANKAHSVDVEETTDVFVDSLDEGSLPAHSVVVRHSGDRMQTKLDHAKVRAIVKHHGGTHDGLADDGDATHTTCCAFPNDTKAALAHKAISDAGLETIDRIVRNRTHDNVKVPMGEATVLDDGGTQGLLLRIGNVIGKPNI